MVKGADEYLREKTQFWVVKPRIAGGQVTGLGTLLSGAYIGIDPVREGKTTRQLRRASRSRRSSRTQEAGRYFVLRSNDAGALDVGSPVFFRRIEVGQVVVVRSSTPDSDFVTTRDLRARALRPARPRRHAASGTPAASTCRSAPTASRSTPSRWSRS